MKILPPSEHPLFVRLLDTEWVLWNACVRFLELHRCVELPSETADDLWSNLCGQDGLSAFSRHLRPNIHPGKGDTGPFWSMIDAIGFWESAHPCAWPYTTIDDCNRYLDWAEVIAGDALSASIH